MLQPFTLFFSVPPMNLPAEAQRGAARSRAAGSTPYLPPATPSVETQPVLGKRSHRGWVETLGLPGWGGHLSPCTQGPFQINKP